MLACVGGAGFAQSLDAERAALSRAKQAGAEAEARAQRLEARATAEQGEAQAAQFEAAGIAARIQAAESDIDAAEARVRIINQLQSELKSRLAARQEPSVRLVAALQTLSRRPPALALAQPGSLQDMVHLRVVMASLLPELRKRTLGLRRDLERGRRLRADSDRALAALAAGRKRLQNQRFALVQSAARHRNESQIFSGSAIVEQERALAMGERARDISGLIGQIGVDSETRARLEELPGPVLRPMDPGQSRVLPSGGSAVASNRLPYRLPVTGQLVTGLGEVSSTGVRARGLTLAVKPGVQVVAPSRGRIVFAGPFRGFGQIVIIDHGAGWTSLLTNMAKLDVRVGDGVAQGGPLGRTQAGEKPRLTVELRRNLKPIDIAWLLG